MISDINVISDHDDALDKVQVHYPHPHPRINSIINVTS